MFTDDSEAAWRAAGADYARSIAPVIQALAEVAGASTRALWAVSVDAVAGAAVGAGNDAFEPYRGVRIAQALLAGMAEGVPEGVRLPQPHFRDFCDGQFQPTDVAAALAGEERDVHTRSPAGVLLHDLSVASSGNVFIVPETDPGGT